MKDVKVKYFDDFEHGVLTPLSMLREFESKWHLEIDLPMVNKEDIVIKLKTERVIFINANLKEICSIKNNEKAIEFSCFKKDIILPEKIQFKKIQTKFEKGILTITIPKNLHESTFIMD